MAPVITTDLVVLEASGNYYLDTKTRPITIELHQVSQNGSIMLHFQAGINPVFLQGKNTLIDGNEFVVWYGEIGKSICIIFRGREWKTCLM